MFTFTSRRHSTQVVRQFSRVWLYLVMTVLVVVTSIGVPIWAGSTSPNPQTNGPNESTRLRQVPGPSPRQTINQFLSTTKEGEQLIEGAIDQALHEPGWFYSTAQRQQAAKGQRLLEQATETLNLSEVPQALHAVTGVGTMLMLRSLLLYDLSNAPQLVLPGPEEVARDKLRSWTIPDSTITLAVNTTPAATQEPATELPCKQCSEQDFLFSPRTVKQVEDDFNRIFADNQALRHRFGANLHVIWSLMPGGVLPPKWVLALPDGWKKRLVLNPIGGQSLLQWLLVMPTTGVALGILVGLLMALRRQFGHAVEPVRRSRYWRRVGLLLLPVAVIAMWKWFCIDWVNLTGDRALAVVITARVLNTVLGMGLFYLLAEAVGQTLIRKRHRKSDGTLESLRRKGAGQLLTIVRVIGLVGAVAVFVTCARSLGLTSVTILALSSVPALAISLGTQQLIKDISDGFSLFLDGQLKVGDRCTIGTKKSGEIDGTVLSMGMRSIILRLKNGSQLSMPNSQVAGSVVTNHSMRKAEQLDVQMSLTKLQPDALADLHLRAQELIATTVGIQDGEAQLDHHDGDWKLHIHGIWLSNLSRGEQSKCRTALLLDLQKLINSQQAEATPKLG